MGAGIVECDVTFTKDKQLVCRHAQNDLPTTTNILETPLAKTCTRGFTPLKTPASAECRTSDITLAEFKTLKGKMDAFNPRATIVAEFLDGTPAFRTDLYASRGALMTHAETSAALAECSALHGKAAALINRPADFRNVRRVTNSLSTIDTPPSVRIAMTFFPATDFICSRSRSNDYEC